MKFVVEGELPSLNEYIRVERGNKYAAAKVKKEWTEAVAWQVKGIPQVKGPVMVKCSWYVKDKRKDPDNVSFGVKGLLDGLVLAGVLPDDGYEWIRGIGHWFFVDKERPRVEVELRDAMANGKQQ